MDITNYSTAKKNIRKRRQKKNIMNKDPPTMPKTKKTNSQLSMSNFLSTLSSNTEDNRRLDEFVFNKINVKDQTKEITNIKDQKSQTTNTDDSDNNSSEDKGSSRKERKPLPLIFNKSCSVNCTDNDTSSEASEDNKETGSSKCVYLGERETLRSFWDKCLYQCFISKRCVAGEKPKRKYRKKLKTHILSSKKRKQLDLPLSCIDTSGTAVTSNDYLSRYETLLYLDPLAYSMTPWQRSDFEMAFRMVKPSDIFALAEDANGESTDYTNSDTD